MLGQDRKLVVVVGILICAIIFGAGYKTSEVMAAKKIQPIVIPGPQPPKVKEKPRLVTVHITGAVKKPGVYTFPEGSRLVDGVNKAEPLINAEVAYINLAEMLKDQQQVFVPKKGEVSAPRAQVGSLTGAGSSRNGAATDSRVNINNATVKDLDSLPGIGPSFAQRIIDYRNKNGGFKSINELLKVPGIGEKKLAQIKDRVCLDR